MRDFRGSALVVAAAAAALGFVGAAVGAAGQDASRLPALYGFAGPPPRLYAVDPRTLRPRRDRSAPLAGHAFGWSFSPDRGRLAAGSDVTAELRLYDLERLRVLGDVELVKPGVHGLVYASTWASRSRVLAAVVTPGCCGLGDTLVSAVDANSRRVVWRRDLAGSLQAGALGGMAVALIVVLCMSGNYVVVRHRRDIGMAPAIWLAGVISGLAALPFAHPGNVTWSQLPWLLALSPGQLAGGLLLYMASLKRIPAGRAALLGLLELVLGPLWVWLFDGEKPDDLTLLGGAIVIGAAAANVWLDSRRTTG